jgi:L-glyceraldehyde 3-phosphate reductase
LRRYRLAAGLTQEELAVRAQVSPRAISDLERGQRTRPWRDTVQLLASALALEPSDRLQRPFYFGRSMAESDRADVPFLSATGIAGGLEGPFDPQRYDGRMPYRRSGRSGLLLPAISLGGWETFGGYRGADVARACLFRAFDLGITHFDFANNYGTPPGNSEIVCGRILKELPRDELIISSKAGYRMWPGPYGDWLGKKYLVASCDQSLKRMGLDYFDVFYLHRPDPETPLEESLGALDLLIRQGKVFYGGVSSFPGALFADAVRVGERAGLAPITIHQTAYNLLNRTIEKDLLPHTQRAGTGVIAFVPLASGLLTDKYLAGEIPADSRAALRWGDEQTRRRLTPERLETVRQLDAIARARGQTLAQMALAWILRLPTITSALIGASRVEQIEQNVGAVRNLGFSAEELAAIDRLTLPG